MGWGVSLGFCGWELFSGMDALDVTGGSLCEGLPGAEGECARCGDQSFEGGGCVRGALVGGLGAEVRFRGDGELEAAARERAR